MSPHLCTPVCPPLCSLLHASTRFSSRLEQVQLPDHKLLQARMNAIAWQCSVLPKVHVHCPWACHGQSTPFCNGWRSQEFPLPRCPPGLLEAMLLFCNPAPLSLHSMSDMHHCGKCQRLLYRQMGFSWVAALKIHAVDADKICNTLPPTVLLTQRRLQTALPAASSAVQRLHHGRPCREPKLAELQVRFTCPLVGAIASLQFICHQQTCAWAQSCIR